MTPGAIRPNDSTERPDPRYLQVRTRNAETWLNEIPSSTQDHSKNHLSAIAEEISRSAERVDGVLHWESDRTEKEVEEIASKAGLVARRDIWQMTCQLPLAKIEVIETPTPLRPFRPYSDDEEAWLRCNNEAFSAHPDQGRENLETLRAHYGEDWFDPTGFWLCDADPSATPGGELAAFCWTRVHRATAESEAMGEIYVIGVASAFQGKQLGTALAVAGLEQLSALGLRIGMLFVEAENQAATAIYDRLGFEWRRTRRVRSRLKP